MSRDPRHCTAQVRKRFRRLRDKSHEARYQDWRSLGGFTASDISGLYVRKLVPLAREMRNALR